MAGVVDDMVERQMSAITGKPVQTDAEKLFFAQKLAEFAKLQYNRFVGEPLKSMSRVGGAMVGQNTYPIDEINDPKTVALKQGQDVLEALGLYSGPGILAGRPSATGLSALGGLRQGAGGKAPVWRSQMEDVLAAKLPGRADSPQMAQTLEAFAKKGEFKPEELEWSGLVDWLHGKSGKVTKQEVQDFLAENNVQVKEVVKGGTGKAGPFQVYDSATGDEIATVATEMEAQTMVRRRPGAAFTDLNKDYSKDTSTVYGQYQLPGGENYRELLLTLPQQKGRFSVKPDESGRFIIWDSEKNAVATSEYGGKLKTIEPYSNEQVASNAAGKMNMQGGYTMPFASSHYQEPNILAHVRFNERVDADGKKVLFIEEVQSDWAQKGRKEGFALSPEKTAPLDSEYRALVHKNAAAREAGKEPLPADIKRAQELEEILLQSDKSKTPDAPFVKDTGKWSMLAMKRMVRYAAENDFDRIAWTTGEQQAARYDLSKQVDYLLYKKNINGTFQVSAQAQGRGHMIGESISAEKLEDYVGKDVAKRMIEGKGEQTNLGGSGSVSQPKDLWNQLEGENLKVGGEGMKGFYDKILPSEVNKFFGKAQWGNARVGQSKISTGSSAGISDFKEWMKRKGYTESVADQWKNDGKRVTEFFNEMSSATVHSLDITPQMKGKAMSEGMPLFSIPGLPGINFGNDDNRKKRSKNNIVEDLTNAAMKKITK